MKNTPSLVGAVAAAMLNALYCTAQSNVVFYGTNVSSIWVSLLTPNFLRQQRLLSWLICRCA